MRDLSIFYGFGKLGSLGEVVSLLIPAAFSIAATAVVIYFVIGAFKLLASGGDKEAVAGGRKMITHAIIGFLLLMMMFLILQFIPQAFGFKMFSF